MLSEQNLRDIEEIKQLKARYVRFGDTRKWDEFATLFTADFEGIFEVMPRQAKDHPTSAVINGLDAFIGGMSALLVGVTTVHQVFSPEITITGPATAIGIWAMHDFVQMPTCVFRGWGHYHEEYVRVDGVWKIKKSRTTRLHWEEIWR